MSLPRALLHLNDRRDNQGLAPIFQSLLQLVEFDVQNDVLDVVAPREECLYIRALQLHEIADGDGWLDESNAADGADLEIIPAVTSLPELQNADGR